ncbi:MAG: HU family DNA-binding protein [Geitlerinemataceae cyanobacterium]
MFVRRSTFVRFQHSSSPKTQELKVMNKGELVDKVADKASVTKKEADAVLTAALETIMEAVSDGDKVTLVGFGSFESRERKAREGRNPKTGQKMTIPETKVPAFSAGKLFKDKVAPNK